MKLHLLENRTNKGYTTFGSIWEKGVVSKENDFQLTDEYGVTIPVQSRVTAYWPDGSVKWVAHTADSEKMGNNVTITPIDKKKKESKISVEATEESYLITGENIQVTIPKSGREILTDLIINEQMRVKKATLVLLLEERSRDEDIAVTREIPYIGDIKEVSVEEDGPIHCVITIKGIHKNEKTGIEKLPFIVRIGFGYDSDRLSFTHTFLYDGDENKDYLKAIGMRFYSSISGENYNRHVKFGVDHGVFHESLNQLLSWRPRIPENIYKAQMDGEKLELSNDIEAEATVINAAHQMPIWGCYTMYQDSPSHFAILKKVNNENCCYLDSLHGKRAPGYAAFGGEQGGLMFAMKNFWQKYPSGYWIHNLDKDIVEATVWLWTPEVTPMDFRHYATKGYDQTYYEGFPEIGATAYGIANTNEFTVAAFNEVIPTDEQLQQIYQSVQKPPVYISTPEYYHSLKAFGYWSMKQCNTELESWLENQLDKAIEFYKNEIEVRNWYGMFNYGDVMHTYDKTRHCWRYDMGGYAWQNTELVPTLWLWLQFMRTGSEEVFTLAEEMTRHCSEVDIYHFGPLKGLGSRHNVRHWGCSCKEARIAMAGHHRYYYYLTGDYRIGDVFDDVKDGDYSIVTMDPLRYFYDKEKMIDETHARSGPDWSSFCSNWMTQWERFNDETYRNKIKVGVEDLKNAPLKLVSGSDFEYSPKTSHLRYIGERAAGGTHLQICMGAPQVWFEMGDLLEDEEWKKMMADFGRFYYLPKEKQIEESKGLINNREFSLPFMAAAMGAYGAAYLKDEQLAKTTWRILMRAMISEEEKEGFTTKEIKNVANQAILQEIPWISTNFTAQWCLNVIMVLEFIREALPQDWEQLEIFMEGVSLEGFRKA